MGFDAADVNALLAPLDETFFRRIYTDLRLGFLALWAYESRNKKNTETSPLPPRSHTNCPSFVCPQCSGRIPGPQRYCVPRGGLGAPVG